MPVDKLQFTVDVGAAVTAAARALNGISAQVCVVLLKQANIKHCMSIMHGMSALIVLYIYLLSANCFVPE